MSKYETINFFKNAYLIDFKNKNLLSHVKMGEEIIIFA